MMIRAWWFELQPADRLSGAAHRDLFSGRRHSI